jgi:hypothetical protein
MAKQQSKTQTRKSKSDRDDKEGVRRQTGSGHGKDSNPPKGRNTAGTSNRPSSR